MTTPAAATTLLLRRIIVIIVALVRFFVRDVVIILVVDDRIKLGRFSRARSRAGDAHLRAFVFALRHDLDSDAVPLLDLDKVVALLIEQVNRCFHACSQFDQRSFALGRFVFDQTQRGEASR